MSSVISYQVFARKYRPKTFDDVLGQDHVVRTLRNAITQNRIAQAYLFVGPRGTGKTSTARILAKALNCPGGPKADFDPNDPLCVEIAEGRSIDVLEIDGASNNSVDQVRALRDSVAFAPANGQFRIFYIDEVHMLSGAAFNALLKTLEEPPAHVKFIFATTEAHKVLPTILSRCQRFDLRPIPSAIIATHLLQIASLEGIKLDHDAAQLIARGADGGMRDAQSMLDQLVAFCGDSITTDDVTTVFGFTASQTIADLATHILARRTADVLNLIHAQYDGGRDLQNLLGEIVTFFRNLLVLSIDPSNPLPEITPEGRRLLESCLSMATGDRLADLVDHLASVQEKMRWAPDKKLHLEMGCVRAIRILDDVSLAQVVDFLRQAAGGTPPPPLPSPASQPAPTLPPAQPEPGSPVATPAPVPLSDPPPCPKPSPAPAPAAPAPAKAPSPAASPDLQTIWNRATRSLEEKGAGFAALIASEAEIRSFENGLLKGDLPASRAFERDLLEEARPVLERILADILGQPLRFELGLSNDVPEKHSLDADDQEDPHPPEDEPPADNLPRIEPDLSSERNESLEDPETFYHDPLIDKAMELFEARRIQA